MDLVAEAAVRRHQDLRVWQSGRALAMRVFHLSKSFPPEERYSLTDQVRRSSRSVTANLAEAWQKRRYQPAFVAKLTDSSAEAAETQDWVDYAAACEYINARDAQEIIEEYDGILRTLEAMAHHADRWCHKP
jgi:four helix bundle protein